MLPCGVCTRGNKMLQSLIALLIGMRQCKIPSAPLVVDDEESSDYPSIDHSHPPFSSSHRAQFPNSPIPPCRPATVAGSTI